MNFEDCARLLLSVNFRFAKTMPQNPHYYTLRSTWDNDYDFVNVVQYIRDNGYDGSFYNKPFKYFNLNGFKYWTMGAPIDLNGKPHTILINKAETNYKSEYDSIADKYVELFDNKESRQEEVELFKILEIGDNVLDIGCGNGMALNYIKPKRYLGIEPSLGMLRNFKRNFPNNETLNVRFEDFWGGGYDTILALFGTPSYIIPETLERIPKMLLPGGIAYLMFMADNYYPITHEITGINPKIYRSNLEGINFTNYKIVKIEK